MSSNATSQSVASSPGLRQRAQARLTLLKTNRQRSALGLQEIVGLFCAAITLLAVVLAYFSFMVPATLNRRSAEAQRTQLETRIKSKKDTLNVGTSKEANFQQISQSLIDFENNSLESRGDVRVALIAELNDLIRTNNLRNTAGPVFMSLAQLGENGKPELTETTRSANNKWLSFYPGIGISMTLEGQYQNLRTFIRDVEANKHFVVINTVQLEKATDSAAPIASAAPAQPGAAPEPVTKNSLVSLQMDLGTYFRRETSDKVNPQPQAK